MNVSKICKNFHTFYDSKIIDVDDIISKTFKDTATKVVKEKIDTEHSNDVLINLVYNHKLLLQPVTEYLTEGPFTITLHTSKKYKKNIYVFGEHHPYQDNFCKNMGIKKEKTMKIQEYFRRLFETTDVFIDFYLEIAISSSNIYPSSDYTYGLKSLRKLTYGCTTIGSKKNCPYPLIRAHAVDTRDSLRPSTSVIANIYKSDEFLYDAIITKDKTEDYYNLFFSDVNKLIKEILDNDYDKFIKFYNKDVLKFRHMKKIDRSTVKNKLKKYLFTELKSPVYVKHYNFFKKYLVDNPKVVNNIHNKDSSKDYSNFRKRMYMFLLIFNVVAMDMYNMARIFKKFNVKNSNQPEEPHNVIVYSGNIHSDSYRGFLTELGFKEVERVKNDNRDYNKCLKMEGLVQPLFSKTPVYT
jgi:hypothetical protein